MDTLLNNIEILSFRKLNSKDASYKRAFLIEFFFKKTINLSITFIHHFKHRLLRQLSSGSTRLVHSKFYILQSNTQRLLNLVNDSINKIV